MNNGLNRILAAIVLYNQPLSKSNTYLTLVESLRELPSDWFVNIFIYDNSPEGQKIEIHLPYTYIHDSSNPGVSKAYNEAAKHAKNMNIEWLLLLDQDTSLSNSFLSQMIVAITQNNNIQLFSPLIRATNGFIISPFKLKNHIGKSIKTEIFGILSAKKYGVINSGMVINTDAFILSGGYCEKVKMDFSDLVFMERFCQKFDNLIIIPAHCMQELSAFDTDILKLKNRFVLFCQGAVLCPKKGIWDQIIYFYIVLKRLFSLIYKNKSLIFVPIFWKNYVCR